MSEELSLQAKRRIRRYAHGMFDVAVDNIRVKWKISPEDWNPSFDIKWKGAFSRGWRDGIYIIFRAQDCISGDRFAYAEYPHVAADPEIGSFYSDSWRPYIQAIVAHELAHSLNILLFPDTVGVAVDEKNYDGNHGKKWKELYRWILKFGYNPGKRTKAPRLSL